MAGEKHQGCRRNLGKILNYLRRYGKLLLLVDFDGTISEITDKPEKAKPVKGVVKALALLNGRRNVSVAVVSGRRISFLRKFFGPEITLVGVHGGEVMAGGKLQRVALDGKHADFLKKAVCMVERERIPGIFLENKEISVAVHYRNVPLKFRGKVRTLRRKIKSEGVMEVMKGKKVFEVKPAVFRKESAVEAIISGKKGFHPVYFGDDVTDEGVFGLKNITGIRVGIGLRGAKFSVSKPDDVLFLLKGLA